jgi:hypothetical protein
VNKIKRLAKDFARWGETRVRRVLAGVKKYGVVFEDFVGYGGKKG